MLATSRVGSGTLAVMTEARRFWEAIEAIFDPELPVDDPAIFAERDPAYNPLVRLERDLRRPSTTNDSKVLVTGTVGNGKTSELNHFAAALAGHRTIIKLDLWSHFQQSVGDVAALSRIEPWELVGLLGVAIYRAGGERWGHHWGSEQKMLERALEELQGSGHDGPTIDLPKLASGMAVAVSGVVGAVTGGVLAGTAATMGMAVLKTATEATRWPWHIGKHKQPQRDDQEVRGVLNAVNAMITALQREYGGRLLLLVDGLDRVDPVGSDPVRSRRLFVESALLGGLYCDVVCVASGAVRSMESSIRAFLPQELCNVPVLDRADPTRPGKGIEFFRSLVSKRVAAVSKEATPPPGAFPGELVDRLAYYSGGVNRDFVRSMRMAAGEAWHAEAEALTRGIVDITLREARRRKEAAMNGEEIGLLERLMIDPERKLPSGHVAAALASRQCLLAYPNETTWYYPHPLLTLALLKPGRGSAG